MLCPCCHQTFAQLTSEGRCPLCGADLATVRAKRLLLSLLVGSLLVAVFVYGGLVALLEYLPWAGSEFRRPTWAAPVGGDVLRYVLLAVALGTFAAMRLVEQKALAQGTEQGMRAAVLLVGALSESVAIYGLLLYFLGHGVQWFAIFAGLALVGFGYLLVRLPAYKRLMDEFVLRGQP